MKKLILSIALFTFTASLMAQKKVTDVAKFSNDVIDQGKLKQNQPEEVKFVITNISKEPLIIETASPTCGCTIGDYTKAPIAPGATGFVSAKFNAASPGHFTKTMTVKFAGVDEVKNITITGDVLTAEEYTKWQAENPAKPQTVVAAPVPAAKAAAKPTAKTAKSAVVKKTAAPAKG